MFNIEIIHFLQSFEHPLISGFMWFITALGLSPMIIFICIGIAFGLDLKRGLVLINIVAWTAFTTTLLKDQIDYPRPADIDPSIQMGSDYGAEVEDLKSIAPKGFFELFSPEFLLASRNNAVESNGFPSGHASTQTALWLSFFLLFRKRWISYGAVAMILLTAISRLYLGFHFLADVIAGILLGALLSYLILWVIKKSRYLSTRTHDKATLGFFWLPWLALPLAPFIGYWQLATVLGLNMAVIYVVQRRNFPVFHVVTFKRVLATLLVVTAFLATFYLNRYIRLDSLPILDFILITLLNFLAVLGSLSLSRRLFLIKYRLAY